MSVFCDLGHRTARSMIGYCHHDAHNVVRLSVRPSVCEVYCGAQGRCMVVWFESFTVVFLRDLTFTSSDMFAVGCVV